MSFKKSMLLTFMVYSCIASWSVYADKKDVVKEIETIKAAIEIGTSQYELNRLLTSAKTEINIADRDDSISDEFIGNAQITLQTYYYCFKFITLANEFSEMGHADEAKDSHEQANSTCASGSENLDKLYDDI